MPRKKVAFQGERGAFSEVALRQIVGKSATAVPCETFDDVFDAVEGGRVDLGVIPIENSLIGSIHRNYDLPLERNLHAIGETQVRIAHSLIAPKGVTLRKIKRVYSHPAALEQCAGFFRKHRRLQSVSFYDTAGAVKMVSESDATDIAAIASPYAAELYKMNELKRSIEDEKINYTRFLLLSRKPKKATRGAKTSLVFSLKNVPGALFKALSALGLVFEF